MSIKTLRKRIAIVAISAVSATGMSLIAAPQANAALADSAIQANTLYIGLTKSATGAAAAPALATGVSSAMTQVGFITATSTTATTTDTAAALALNTTIDSSAINTALVYPGAELSFLVGGSASAADGLSVVVTGGTLTGLVSSAIGSAATTVAAANVNENSTAVFTDNDGAGNDSQGYGLDWWSFQDYCCCWIYSNNLCLLWLTSCWTYYLNFWNA